MRGAILMSLLGLALAAAQEGTDKPAKRYGIEVNSKYSQKTPEESLKSVLLAIEARSWEYLLAQLADPEFVDGRVKQYKKQAAGSEEAKTFRAFSRLVLETAQHFQEDPLLVKELKLFAKEGEWKADEKSAMALVKTLPGRQLFLKKLQNRWFLENRQK